MSTMDRLLIAGETYSSNLGDGVIATCLAYLFSLAHPDTSLAHLDISGRLNWEKRLMQSGKSGDAIDQMKRTLLSSPRPLCDLVRLANWFVAKRNSLQLHWCRELQDVSTLVIGGGQLLMDNCLDFPLKIHLLTKLARSFGIHVHFSACGVGAQWSQLGKLLLEKSLVEASSISVRDHESYRHLTDSRLAICPSVTVTFDPAIYAATAFGSPSDQDNREDTVGLGVIGLREVNSRNSRRCVYSHRSHMAYWIRIIQLIVKHGIRVQLFTNGSVSDHRFAEQLSRAASRELSIECDLQDRPTEPIELVHQVSQYKAVVASRLHASIIAWSFRIPSIGFAWDAKVRAIYTEAGRDNYCFDHLSCRPETIVDALLSIIDKPICEDELIVWRERAYENIRVVLGW